MKKNQATRIANATLFMSELSDSVETLSGIADQYGTRTLADLMYLQNAILRDGYIDHYPGESKVMEIAMNLPSWARWASFITVVHQPSEEPGQNVGEQIEQSDQDLFLLIMEGDVEPSVRGPFMSETERIEAARQYRQNEGNDDGLYRLSVPKGITPSVESFGGAEIEGESDPFVSYIVGSLSLGERPISRMKLPGFIPQFTVLYQGDEVIFTLDMLKEVEQIIGDNLILVEEPNTLRDYLLPSNMVAEQYRIGFWQTEVSNGETKLGFAAWQRSKLSPITLGSDLLEAMG